MNIFVPTFMDQGHDRHSSVAAVLRLCMVRMLHGVKGFDSSTRTTKRRVEDGLRA